MTDSPRVILIHGTWTDSPGWHRFDSNHPGNFCAVLDSLLAERGMCGSIEKNTEGDRAAQFSWSGANDHRERLRAGQKLGEQFKRITSDDPTARIHLVAHSHGCNVALKAIESYLQDLRAEANKLLMAAIFSSDGNASLSKALDSIYGSRAGEIRNACAESFKILEGARIINKTRAKDRRILPYGPFINSWITSPAVNRLGKIVFLGPPFLTKHWKKRTTTARFLLKLGDYCIGFLLCLAFIYLMTLAIWTPIWLLTLLSSLAFSSEALRAPSFNPLEWDNVLLGISGVISGLAGLAVGAISVDMSRRSDANFYFNLQNDYPPFVPAPIEDLKSNGNQRVLPLKCLTITAELLDEVMLGFSSEPIVFGVLAPQINELFRPKISLHMPRVPFGHQPGLSENLGRALYALRRFLTGIALWTLSPVSKIWRRRVAKDLLRLMSSAAFGIPLYEIRNAIVVAKNEIGIRNVFEETFWDVTKHLVNAAIHNTTGGERESRYSFLWSEGELTERKNKSWLWSRVGQYKNDIANYYPSHGRRPRSLP